MDESAPQQEFLQMELADLSAGRVPLWQGYSPDVLDEDARIQFRNKYGYWPQEIRRSAASVLAGPVEESNNAENKIAT